MVHSVIRDNHHRAGYWGRGAAGLVISAGSFEHGYILRNGFPTANSDQAMANGVLIRGGSVTDSVIEGNYGGANRENVGAGANLEGGLLERCIVQCNTNNAGVSANKARHAGGVAVTGAATVRNCLIAANKAVTASTMSAGGIYANSASAVIRHVTVVGNSSAAGIGGVYLASGDSMKASVVASNSGVDVSAGAGIAEVWTDGVNFRDLSAAFPVSWETADAYSITAASAGYNAVRENYAETDLLGKPRPVIADGSEDYPDAGAMEKVGPAPGEIAASVMPSSATVPVGAGATFTVVLDGDDAEITSCEWTISLGGEEVSKKTVYSAGFVFRPDQPGIYTLSVKATNSSGKTAPEISITVTASPSVCYVAPDGANIFPYDTEAKAARSIGAAINAVFGVAGNPGVVRVLPGEYSGLEEMPSSSGYTYVGVLDKPVTVIGVGGPANTVIRYASTDLGGGFWIADADASLSGLTISGSVKVDNDSRWAGFANAVTLMNGAVSNCVITGCSVEGTHIVPIMNIAGGIASDISITGNSNIGRVWGRGPLGVYITGGVLTNSIVSGCAMTKANHDLLRAGGIYMKGGLVAGCRIENNKGATAQSGSSQTTAGGVLMEGGRLVNTLIAGNTNETANAGSRSAGGLLIDSSSAVADHVTVADNRCLSVSTSLCAVYIKAGTLKNSIVYGNDALDILTVGGTVSYTCWPQAAGSGNIQSNPGLQAFKGLPFVIKNTSPCAHAGESRTYMGWYAPFSSGLVLMLK